MDLIFIPARKGEHNKNLWPINGRPMVDYVMATAWEYQQQFDPGTIDVVVSTDCPEIASMAYQYFGCSYNRPEELAGPLAKIEDALVAFLFNWKLSVIERIALMQPTSPFINQSDLDRVFNALMPSSSWLSAQTVINTPHNFHWMNSRWTNHAADDCSFRFAEERQGLTNKQLKPHSYSFGNLVGVKVEPFMEHKNLWVQPSCPLEIMRTRALDVDNIADLPIAEAYIDKGLVKPTPSRIQ